MNKSIVIVWACALACSQTDKSNREMSLHPQSPKNAAKPALVDPTFAPGQSTKIFNTLEDLRAWTAESSYGGGRLIVLRQKGATYLVADRMFTSGMISSEVNVFKEENGKYVHVYYLPLKYVSRKYELVDGDLVVTEQSGARGAEKLVIGKEELRAR